MKEPAIVASVLGADYEAQVDVLLVMTVNPGFGGQAYLETMEGKVSEARG